MPYTWTNPEDLAKAHDGLQKLREEVEQRRRVNDSCSLEDELDKVQDFIARRQSVVYRQWQRCKKD
ncbi:MAG: hypothetical protein QOH93_1224 [Chloroflexia bacterium]|jgi:hypothetical protein|nr:hypothetical protein [Chloroflexia bacterium]